MMKLTTLIDRMEVIKEVLLERETAVTDELVEAIDYAIGLLAEMISTEKLIPGMMNPNDFMQQFLTDMEFMFGQNNKRNRRRRR